MTEIAMASQWVNRNTGKWVTVTATIPAQWPDNDLVRIADSQGREINVEKPWFLETFCEANDPTLPYPGEQWSVGYTHVTIKTVSDGYVVYEKPDKACEVQRLEVFHQIAQRGKVERPLPDVDGDKGEAIYFPVWEYKGERMNGPGYINTAQTFRSPAAIRKEKPWRCLGIVGIPLDWDKMFWVPRED